jgi:hypothetical protein
MAINLTTKYSPKVAERFTKQSLTAGAASNEYEFDGIKSLKVYSVDTVPLTDYQRSGMSRYGNPAELTDTLQLFTMEKDRSFTYTIDKGNEKEQMNIKAANRTLKREIDERIVPELDKYRFSVWCKGAGAHVSDGGSALTKNNITEKVMDCTEKLDEAYAPESGRTMFIPNKNYKLLKLNPDFIECDKLAPSALVKGQVGEIDGMRVVKVPNTYLPAGVEWLITHKSALLAPVKLQDYKIHADPPGLNGDLVEGRVMHDAFIIGTKAGAVCTFINNSYMIQTPTITNDTTNSKFTIKSNTTGVDIWYTTDGSDPYYSDSAVKGTANSVAPTYAQLNNAAKGYNNSVVLRAVAVPNSNTALFRGDLSETVQYA